MAAPSGGGSDAAGGSSTVPVEEVSVQLFNFFACIGMDQSPEAQGRQEEVLSSLASMGYKNVEPVDYTSFQGLTAEQYRALLDKYGLSASSLHTSVSMETTDAQWSQALSTAKTIGAGYIGAGSTPSFTTEAEWIAYAEKIDHLGALASEAGVQYIVHSHDWEFASVSEGKTAYDILQEYTSTENVAFELDLYWATKAGVDPIGLIDTYGDRIELLHVKDMAEDGSFATVGEGTIDFAPIFAAAGDRVSYYVVERDPSFSDPDFDPFAPAEKGLENLLGVEFSLPTQVQATPSRVSFEVGDQTSLLASVLPAGAHQRISWSSADESIATVDESGALTAIDEGSTTIVATATAKSSVSAVINVTVTRVPVTEPGGETEAALTLSPGTVRAGEAVSATATGFSDGEEVVFELVPQTEGATSAQSSGLRLGAGTTSPQGTIEIDLRIPAESDPGEYLVVATGTGSGLSASAELAVARTSTSGTTTSPTPEATSSTEGTKTAASVKTDTGLAKTGYEPIGLMLAGLLLLAGAGVQIARRTINN